MLIFIISLSFLSNIICQTHMFCNDWKIAPSQLLFQTWDNKGSNVSNRVDAVVAELSLENLAFDASRIKRNGVP